MINSPQDCKIVNFADKNLCTKRPARKSHVCPSSYIINSEELPKWSTSISSDIIRWSSVVSWFQTFCCVNKYDRESKGFAMKQTLVLAIKSVCGLDKTRCFYSCLKLLVNYHIWITNAPSGLSFSFYPVLSASSCLVFLKVFYYTKGCTRKPSILR